MGKIAFVFPGQGAQTVGMGREFCARFPAAAAIYAMAGEEVKALSFDGPAETLNLTVHAQPCLLAADLAAAAALGESGIHAEGTAGFSLGEIAGLALCGLLSAESAFAFVRRRAGAMHECALRERGGMFAVLGLSAARVSELCAGLEGAYPANFNCANQTVVACRDESAEAVKSAVAAAGGKALKLAVSGAFHSPLMDGATGEIRRCLAGLPSGKPAMPLYANLTGETYGQSHGRDEGGGNENGGNKDGRNKDGGESWKECTVRQVNSPVLWQKTVENMIRDGFDTFVEAGPGKTLSGLIGKISKEVKAFNVYDMASLENTVSACARR